MDHVWGYTIVNDVTARLAGPPQAVADGQVVRHLLPDGAVRGRCQRAGRSEHHGALLDQRRAAPGGEHARLIFDIPTLIETISARITLYPGDIIATGTPAGVGIGFTPPKYLKAGDKVRIEIDGIGVLENPVQ